MRTGDTWRHQQAAKPTKSKENKAISFTFMIGEEFKINSKTPLFITGSC